MGFRSVRVWSPAEDEFLREHWGTSDRHLAQLQINLARTTTAIRKRAQGLGITEGKTASPKTPVLKLRQGRRPDLQISVRSPWEANVLRVLTHHHIRWEYEPKTFFFLKEKRGAVHYTPDIYLPDLDLWIEVKGQLKSDGRSKIRKFKRYYPKEFERLRCIPGTPGSPAAKWFASFDVPLLSCYNVLRYDYALKLPFWEHDEISVKWADSKRIRKRPEDLGALKALIAKASARN